MPRLLENEEILVPQEVRNQGFKSIAERIYKDYQEESCDEVVMVGILKGGVVTTVHVGEALEELGLSVNLQFIGVETYLEDNTSTKQPKLTMGIKPEIIKGKNVLISDDLRDGGHTLEFVHSKMEELGAKSIKILVMGDKEENLETDVEVNYVIFKFPGSKWLFGSGMDKDGKGRRLAGFIGAVVSQPSGSTS